MVFHKSGDYVLTLCCVHKMLFDKSRTTQDKKLYCISVVILKYIKKACDELGVDTRKLEPTDKFDLAPVYEYVRDNQIHLYDLDTISEAEVDPKNDADVERFVLSHINYIFKRPTSNYAAI